MTDEDRETLCAAVRESPSQKIIIVHGTDTMERSAAYLAERLGTFRQILFTGAMVPYAVDPVEATANLASAVGRLRGSDTPGVYIAMHGLILPHDRIVKDRTIGRFVPRPT
jgi:L-asparaginase